MTYRADRHRDPSPIYTDAVLDVKGLRQLRALARETRLMALDRQRQ
ncbi:MAG: hypothetical protein ABI216_01445 [Devosia sp.]